MLKYVMFVLVMFWLSPLHAQNKSNSILTGKIVDEDDSIIANANLRLYGLNLKTKSDASGNFKFTNIPNHKNYRLKITMVGYEEYQDIIHLEGDSSILIRMHQKTEKLEGIKVSAKQVEQVTVVKHSLNEDLIQETKGKVIADIFSNLSGVSTLSSGNTVVKPVINGLHSNRIAILNQGVKLESQQWGMEHAPEIDGFSADEFELIKGAQAVRYGADALGGVLIAQSNPIQTDSIKGKANLIAQTQGQGITANLQLTGGFESIQNLGWKIQASGKKLGNSQTEKYYLGNTGVNELNFSSALQYQIDKHKAEVFYSRFSTQLGVLYAAHIGSIEDIFARIENGEPFEKYDFTYKINAPKQYVTHQLAKLKYQFSMDNGSTVDALYSWQQNHRKEFDFRRTTSNDVPMSDMVLTNHQLEILWKLRGNSLGFSVGSQVNNNTPGTGTTPIIPNYDQFQLAVFGMHNKRFEKLMLELGWRYDFRNFDAAGYRYKYTEANQAVPVQYLLTDKRNFHNVSGSLGLKYQFSEKWEGISNLGLAWRAPSANEMYSDGVHHAAGIYEIGNLNLKAEKGVKWVNSLKHQNENLSFNVDAYVQYIFNYIYAMPQPDSVRQTIRGTFPVFSYTQHNALFYGLDVKANYKITSNLSYNINANLVRAKNLSLDSYLPYIPADRIIHGIQWNYHESSKGYVKFNHQFVDKQHRYQEESDYTAPPAAYHLFHAYASQPINLGKRNAIISFAVENLFNKSYKDYMDRFRYYAHKPGRNFILSFNYTF